MQEIQQAPNNYELCCREWQQRFLQMDHQALTERLPGMQKEGDRLTLSYFGRPVSILLKDGSICQRPGEEPLSVNDRLSLYTLLGYCREGAALSDQWVPFRLVRGAGPFNAAFEQHLLKPFAQGFSGHLEQLHAAARSLGGKLLPQGDAGYQIDTFECIPLRFLFWEGDEEIAAQANILFDYSVTDFIHVESTVLLATAGVRRLARRAQVQLPPEMF
jgi:hypothetical protein